LILLNVSTNAVVVCSRRQQRNAVAATVMWAAAALALAVFLFRTLGTTAAIQFLSGYAIEETLSIALACLRLRGRIPVRSEPCHDEGPRGASGVRAGDAHVLRVAGAEEKEEDLGAIRRALWNTDFAVMQVFWPLSQKSTSRF
jgi:hypothetical protein